MSILKAHAKLWFNKVQYNSDRQNILALAYAWVNWGLMCKKSIYLQKMSFHSFKGRYEKGISEGGLNLENAHVISVPSYK